jgi:hypothetical protein
VRGGHPDLLRCRPTAAPPAPVVRRETRADSAQTFPLTFTIPAPRRRDACDVRGETGRDTPIEAITDDARGGAAPAAGAAGRPVSVQKYRGELPKTSTVISISSTRLYVLHTSCYPYNTQTHAGASTAAFEWNVQDPISHWT